MAITYRVDITNAAGTLQGSGPIKSVSSWTVTKRMDRAGDWSFVMAGSDAQRSVVVVRNIAKIYAKMGTTWTYVGGGYIDQVGRRINEDGTIDVMVSGKDMLRSLTHTLASGEYDDTFTNIVNSILPSGWTATITTPPVSDLYTTLQYDTVLSALVRLSERAQTHFYLSGDDTVVFNHTWTDSGVRAIQGQDVTADELAAIVALDIDEQSYDVVSRVYPLGSGNSGSALGLLATTQTAPAGYTLSAANNYVESDAAVAAYGALHRRVDFKDVRPISGTDADVQAAADMLFDSALYWLTEHETPTTSYRLMLAECGTLLRPLQTTRLAYRDSVAGIELNDDLYILESTWAGNSDGVTTTELVVADSTRWPESDTSAIVDSITGGQVYQVHPQLNANSYVMPYTKHVDETEQAEFRFRFDDEVLQLNRCTFDFQLLELESTVLSVGTGTGGSGDLTTEGNNDASAAPSNDTSGVASGNTGSATGNTGSTAGTAAAVIGNTGATAGTAAAASGNTGATAGTAAAVIGNTAGPSLDLSGNATGSTGNASGNTGNATGNTGSATGNTGASGTLTTEIPNERDDTDAAGDHRHFFPVDSATYDGANDAYIFYDNSRGALSKSTSGSANIYVSYQGEHDHDLNAHTHDLNSHAHDLNSHAHDLNNHAHTLGGHTHDLGGHTHTLNNHTHTVDSHTHTLNSHTHTVDSHTHTLNSHTHTVDSHTHTLNSHSHTLNNHTHTLNNHTHTLNNHVHDLTAAITTTYGIFRDSAANLFDITDLEYSVDGATWYDFTVSVNGFTVLGDGWYRIDITDLIQNSSTLRPTTSNNLLRIRREAAGATGKKATIDAQLNVRTIIQATAYL